MAIESFQIDDAIDQPQEGAVEVTITMLGGEKRWCFFMSPDRLAQVGDYVEGTNIRLHLGVPHMIVVSEITEEIVEKVIAQLDAQGEISEHTIPIE